MTPSIVVSDGVAIELKRVNNREGHESIDETIRYIIENPMPGYKPVEQRGLTREFRISGLTKDSLRMARDRMRFEDFDGVLREALGIATKVRSSTNPDVDATLKGSTAND